jgi:RHS repeat-associated protein
MTVNGQAVAFEYDAAGRLLRKSVAGVVQRHFLWDGASLLAELNGTGTAKEAEYSYYLGLDNPHALIVGSTQYFAHTDGLGNVIALTDTFKNVQRTYAFAPWGALTGGTDYASFAGKDRARFKGALWLGPEAELYYMRARWYEPQTGRFLSEDPIGLAGGINPYTYAGADAINGRDPLGLCGTLFTDNGQYRPGRTAAVGEVLEGPDGHLYTCGCGGWVRGIHPLSASDCIGSQPGTPVPGSAPGRTPQQCFDQSTAPVRGPAGRIAAGAGAAVGSALAAAGAYMRSWGGRMAEGQNLVQALIRATPDLTRVMQPFYAPVLATAVTGAATAQAGAAWLEAGVFTLVGVAGLTATYFATTSVICDINPDWL